MGSLERTVVQLSLDPDTVSEADRFGVDLSHIAERAITDEIARRRVATLQDRVDKSMDHWNRVGAESAHPSVADEFGTI